MFLMFLMIALQNPYCLETGFSLAPGSPAIDTGVFIPGFHCPTTGKGDGKCVEWYGKSPDIGACEFRLSAIIPPTITVPSAPAKVVAM